MMESANKPAKTENSAPPDSWFGDESILDTITLGFNDALMEYSRGCWTTKPSAPIDRLRLALLIVKIWAIATIPTLHLQRLCRAG